MYCDIPQVNQLTALLLSHGLTRIVACPGSRNATLLHNFREAGFTLYPATDERSAAFVALGIVLATDGPAAVCVTSGSALLATLPTLFYKMVGLSLPLAASSLLIAVSVAIETARQLQAQMEMRHYKGFLK